MARKSTTTKVPVDSFRSFYERRHPAYLRLINHWAFVTAAYTGGRDWFYTNIFKYHKEGDTEFSDRLQRAYRFNHTREAVDLLQKYLFKAVIARNDDDADPVVTAFWDSASLEGLDIDQLMRTVTVGTSIGGRVAVVVDNNLIFPDLLGAQDAANAQPKPVSIADIKQGKARIYAYVVQVADILDYSFDVDGDGQLLWIKLREIVRDDEDPLNSTGLVYERVRLWTRTSWTLFEEYDINPADNADATVGVGGSPEAAATQRHVRQISRGDHNLGRVPVVLVDHTVGHHHPYAPAGLIDDIAYLDRAVANYLSNLDAIIQDQTFSQLAIPASAMQPGDDQYTKVLEMGTKRVFVYDGGSGSTAKPEYLSPDPKQAGVILTVINKIIGEIYHTIGLAGERTKDDNSQGIDNSSGVAKAYDFERVNSLLLAKAASAQIAENQLVELVLLWAGKPSPAVPLVKYPDTFDVMRLTDELQAAQALAMIAAPLEVRREQMRITVEKMFPKLTKDLKTKIMADIDTWLEGTDILPPPTNFGAPVAAPSRQGQVTKDTPTKPTTPKAPA